MCDNHTHAPQIKRHFYKCHECLSFCAVDSEYGFNRVLCSLCHVPMHYMGRVEQTRLKIDTVRCLCDARCTFATGPNCECSCGGVNHGKGVVVEVTIDAGKVPTAQIKPTAQVLYDLKQYRTLRDQLQAELNDVRQHHSGPSYLRSRILYAALQSAASKTSHAGRMKALKAATGNTAPCSSYRPACSDSHRNI